MADVSASATLANDEADQDVSTPLTRVAPLYYTQLRLMAECAEGTAGGQTQFVFDDGTLSVLPSLNSGVLDDQILITAENGGRRPANTINLQVTAGATLEDGSPPLPLESADAVFWSDAAVQKFLFPYIASCGGHQAAEHLTMVQAAWNFYPAGEVTVYALVHTIAQPGEVLGLGSITRVVYTVGTDDTLQIAQLGEFVQRYRPVTVAASAGGEVDYWRGAPGAYQYPDYTSLRKMAEYVSSLREEPQYFICPPDAPARFEGPSPWLPLDLVDGTIVVPVHNPTIPAARPQLGGVWFSPPAPMTGSVNLSVQPGMPGWTTSADALFWSTGAAEQFLFSYYASKSGFEGLKKLGEMAESWVLDRPIFLGAEQPPVVVGSPGPGETLQVLGLIHMPTSEWTQMEGWGEGSEGFVRKPESPAGHEVVVLYADAQGQVNLARAAEFRAKHPHRRG